MQNTGLKNLLYILKRTSKSLALMIFLFLQISPSLSAEELPEFFTPVGPMGMGGAFTAVANDENSVWTNPAGISRVRKARARSKLHLAKFPNLIAGANSASRSFYSGVQSSQSTSSSTVLANSEELDTKPFWARVAIAPMAFFELGKNNPAAFGIFMNTQASAVITAEDPERAQVKSTSDLGAIFGWSFSNQSNRFSAGFNVRPVHRYAFEDNIATSLLTDHTEMTKLMQDGSNTSTGLGVDLGMIYTLADYWFPTFGVSLLNAPLACKDNYLNPFSEKRETVCGTVYSGSFANEDALSTIDPTDIRAGLSITPRLSRTMALRIAIDMHHIHFASGTSNYGLSGVDAGKTLHAGLELLFGNPLLPSPFSLKFGANQGFITTGMTLRMPYFSFELVSYGTDLSSQAKTKEDRRIVSSLSFDF
ncbi:MAG: hypothetical protein KBD78_00130 [Oligoflexales bacterium]|nr:hypothetical protein [Oligoflexales bacterium]